MSEKIVQLNEEVIKGQIKELVRGSVEETLNKLLEAEAEKLTQAARYERNEIRQGYRSGHYDRNLTTTSGDVTLHVPRLKGVSFETAIIERYRRRESSVEEALIEMYLAGVSVRRVEDITEALWGSKVSPATISELNKKAYVHIEDWRNRPLQGGRYPYVYVDGIYLRRNWGGEYENVAILVAIAVNEDGYREVLGAAEGMKEDKASWVSFFQEDEGLCRQSFQRDRLMRRQGVLLWQHRHHGPLFQHNMLQFADRFGADKAKIHRASFDPFLDGCIVALMDHKFHTGVLRLKCLQKMGHPMGGYAGQGAKPDHSSLQPSDFLGFFLNR